MHFWEGLGIATISRALGVEQKPLYRRIGRLLDALRRRLTETGVDQERVADFLEMNR
jgi:hypothetical protein